MDVRFERQYVNYTGRRFMRFRAGDGRAAEIRVRDTRQGPVLYTRAEARVIAVAHLAGQCAPPCPVTTCRAVTP